MGKNEDIRQKTGSWKMEDIVRERRLRWLGHVLRMDNSRTAHQATQWELRRYKRKPGRPRKNWVEVIKRDLRQMDLTSEEAEELVNDKAEWRRRVAQFGHLDAGRTKVSGDRMGRHGCDSHMPNLEAQRQLVQASRSHNRKPVWGPPC